MSMPKLKPHPIPDAALDAALDADIAILSKEGRGKTFTAKGIIERLLQMQRRVLVRLEKGRSLPSTTTLLKIAAATGHRLGISLRR